jgi:general secretion pathway protein J
MPLDGQVRFSDPVVLVRLPYRVTFSYAGPDQGWQPDWRGQRQLPEKIRIAVRDGATLQMLALSSVAILHNNGFAGCAGSDDASACQAAAAKAAADNPAPAKKDGEP